MSERILVTGGMGFIGSYITHELLNLGYEPILLDAHVQYVDPNHVNAELYFHYQQQRWQSLIGKVEILRGNTFEIAYLRRIIMQYRPSRIIHLSGLPLANMSQIYSEEAFNSILVSTQNLLEIIRDTDFVERFVYTSSSMTYGDFKYTPADENHPQNPKNIYGAVKLCGEILTRSYGQSYGIEYTIVRPSAVYGPGDLNRRVVQIFVENALQGQPIVMRGADETRLDFSYVKDVAKGFVQATLHPNARNEIFNITRGEGRSLRELAAIIKQHVPEVQITEEPTDKTLPLRGGLAIDKAQEMIGYSPEYNLERGVGEYIESVRSLLEAETA